MDSHSSYHYNEFLAFTSHAFRLNENVISWTWYYNKFVKSKWKQYSVFVLLSWLRCRGNHSNIILSLSTSVNNKFGVTIKRERQLQQQETSLQYTNFLNKKSFFLFCLMLYKRAKYLKPALTRKQTKQDHLSYLRVEEKASIFFTCCVV